MKHKYMCKELYKFEIGFHKQGGEIYDYSGQYHKTPISYVRT